MEFIKAFVSITGIFTIILVLTGIGMIFAMNSDFAEDEVWKRMSFQDKCFLFGATCLGFAIYATNEERMEKIFDGFFNFLKNEE